MVSLLPLASCLRQLGSPLLPQCWALEWAPLDAFMVPWTMGQWLSIHVLSWRPLHAPTSPNQCTVWSVSLGRHPRLAPVGPLLMLPQGTVPGAELTMPWRAWHQPFPTLWPKRATVAPQEAVLMPLRRVVAGSQAIFHSVHELLILLL